MSIFSWSFTCGFLTGITIYAMYKWLCDSDLNHKKKIMDSNDDCLLFSPDLYISNCTLKANFCKHFSCSSCNFKRFISLIESAQYSLDVCVYLITSDKITAAVRSVFKRGVFVRIIVDKQMSEEAFNSKMFVFIKEHVPIKVVNSGKMMHNKFVIIDKSKLITGSFNWTLQGTSFNYENAVVIHNSKIIKKFDSYFQEIWDFKLDNAY